MDAGKRFERFASRIAALPGEAALDRADVLVPDFRLRQDGPISVYYVPFEYVNGRLSSRGSPSCP
jgi:hypothetical protein